jgi:putative transposase
LAESDQDVLECLPSALTAISEATYYNRKKKYGGLGVPELRRLKQLEEENQHLKQ